MRFFFKIWEFKGGKNLFILLNQTQLQLSRILAILTVFLFHKSTFLFIYSHYYAHENVGFF